MHLILLIKLKNEQKCMLLQGSSQLERVETTQELAKCMEKNKKIEEAIKVYQKEGKNVTVICRKMLDKFSDEKEDRSKICNSCKCRKKKGKRSKKSPENALPCPCSVNCGSPDAPLNAELECCSHTATDSKPQCCVPPNSTAPTGVPSTIGQNSLDKYRTENYDVGSKFKDSLQYSRVNSAFKKNGTSYATSYVTSGPTSYNSDRFDDTYGDTTILSPTEEKLPEFPIDYKSVSQRPGQNLPAIPDTSYYSPKGQDEYYTAKDYNTQYSPTNNNAQFFSAEKRIQEVFDREMKGAMFSGPMTSYSPKGRDMPDYSAEKREYGYYTDISPKPFYSPKGEGKYYMGKKCTPYSPYNTPNNNNAEFFSAEKNIQEAYDRNVNGGRLSTLITSLSPKGYDTPYNMPEKRECDSPCHTHMSPNCNQGGFDRDAMFSSPMGSPYKSPNRETPYYAEKSGRGPSYSPMSPKRNQAGFERGMDDNMLNTPWRCSYTSPNLETPFYTAQKRDYGRNTPYYTPEKSGYGASCSPKAPNRFQAAFDRDMNDAMSRSPGTLSYPAPSTSSKSTGGGPYVSPKFKRDRFGNIINYN